MIVCWTNTRLVRVKLKVIFPVRYSSSDQSRRWIAPQKIYSHTWAVLRASLNALGLSDGATQIEIREAYLQLTKVNYIRQVKWISNFELDLKEDYHLKSWFWLFWFRSEHACCSLFFSVLRFQHPGISSWREQRPQSIRRVSQSEDCLWSAEKYLWRRRGAETISWGFGKKTRSRKHFQDWGKY